MKCRAGAHAATPHRGARALPMVSTIALLFAACAESSTVPAGSFGAEGQGDGGTASSGIGGGTGSRNGSAAGSAASSGNASTGADAGGGAGPSGAGGSGSGVSATSGSGTGTGVTGSGASASASGANSGSAMSGSGGSANSSGGAAATDASTGSTSGANSCTKASAACVASNTGCNVGSYYLYDNQWNCGASSGNHCGPESAYGCDDGNGTVSFVVTSNQPAGNTAVLTYPAMQDNFSNPLLSSFKTITATFQETSPHVGDYEVAWDCWFNSQANELMIWVDNYNQTPAGNKVASNVSLGGRSYDVWWASSSGYIVFYANTAFTSGTVDLLQIFNYAVSKGWLPANSTVGQLSFGIEVCSTNGQDATWSFSNYSITAN